MSKNKNNLLNDHKIIIVLEKNIKYILTEIHALIIGTVGLDIFIPNDKKARERLVRKRRQTWRKVFHAGILIEPHIPELEEFKEYFNDAIRVRYFF